MISASNFNTEIYTWLVVTTVVISNGSQLSAATAIDRPITEDQFLPLLFKYIHTNLSSYRCNFDRPDLCAFRRSGVWSFRHSVAEFADLMQKAAKDAADAEAKFVAQGRGEQVLHLSEKNKAEGVDSSFSPLNTFTVPTVNYFPCSSSPVALTKLTQVGSPVNPVPPARSRHPSLSTLELRLPWVQLVRVPVPLTPPEDATDTSEYFTRHGRATPSLSSYPPVACLSVDVRFPSTGNGYFSVAFSPLIQSLHSSAPNKMPSSSETLSIAKSDLMNTQTISTSNISPLPHHLPINTWITLIAPVHIDIYSQSVNQSGITFISGQHSAPLIFHMGSKRRPQDTWAVTATRSSLLLDAGEGVCIDNFHLYPFANVSHARSAGRSHCQRQLQWLDANRSSRSIVYLDDSGNPLPATEPPLQANHLSLTPGSFLSAYNENLSSGGITTGRLFNWMSFSGSLILAVSATLLFLCLCMAVILSVVLARKQRRHRVPHRPTGKRIYGGVPPYTSPQILSTGSKLNWVASNSLCGTDEHLSTLRSGSQSMPQCELSLPLNELLILPEGGDSTERTSVTNPSVQLSTAPEQQPLDETVDPAITSAWQFMRNLRFHRRKGGRLLKQLDAQSRAVISRPQPPSLQHEIPRRPVPIYRRPAMNLNISHMVKNTLDTGNESAPLTSIESQPANVTRRNRRTVSATSAIPYRHSLMLSVNQDNELILRPMETTAECAHTIGSTGSLPHDMSIATRHQGSNVSRVTPDTRGTVSHDQQTTPSTVARSMLPSDGSGPPSYAESSEAG